MNVLDGKLPSWRPRYSWPLLTCLLLWLRTICILLLAAICGFLDEIPAYELRPCWWQMGLCQSSDFSSTRSMFFEYSS